MKTDCVNISNEGFTENLNSLVYVDKSSQIDLLNAVVKTNQKYICISRPRRFGKSVTAKMLCAYYGRGFDSSSLFDNLSIASYHSYKKYLNSFNTIFINMTDEHRRAEYDVYMMFSIITKRVLGDLKKLYPDVVYTNEHDLSLSLNNVYNHSSVPFVIVIDEWDCILRENSSDEKSIRAYLEWLKGVFKDQSYVALGYMTGILPIKKYGTQSALNMFREFSMTDPDMFAPYIGFTADEVKDLCSKYDVDFFRMKKWYDGYSFLNTPHIYNPNSVVEAIIRKRFGSYWTQTETYEALKSYIDMNYEGLKNDILRLLSGQSIVISIKKFSNDMTSFSSKNDVMTLLLHLGYLATDFVTDIPYDSNRERLVHIPNQEIRDEFIDVMDGNAQYPGVYDLILGTANLLNNIWNCNCEEVARAFDKSHLKYTSALNYNSENALSTVVALSLLLSMDTYTLHRELRAGKGFADLVYLPKKGVDKPALLIELKWNRSKDSALAQIKEREYLSVFEDFDYKGEVLLLGINYSTKSKTHECVIKKAEV